MSDQNSNLRQQPRVPGVKYRRVRRQRLVETTIGGETRLTTETYKEWEPVPPRNFDVIGLRVVVGLAIFMTAVSVLWSTASIGDQLSSVVTASIAYGAATLFEATWIGLQIVEWLLRYDPARAKPAMVGGWIALAVVVASVVTHGVDKHKIAAGFIGGGVSILAKGMWVVVLRMFHVPLGEGAADFLRQKREEMAVDRVTLGEQRRLDGQQAYLNAVYGTEAVQALKATRPAQAPELPVSASAAVPALPAAPAGAPVPAQPALQHVPAPSVPAPSVAPVAAPAPVSAAQPVAPTPAQPPAAATAMPGPALQVVGGITYIADTVREALKTNPGISDDDLIAYVAGVHGTSSTLASTVTRTRRRIENPAPTKRKRA